MLECPRCKSNMVTNMAEDLLCLHCGYREVLEDYTIATPGSYFPIENKRIEELADKVNDLEAISAQRGAVPRYYEDRARQQQGQINFLQGKLNEHIDKPRKKPQQVSKLKDIEV